jgi:uncharacterized membrane protein
MMPLEFLYALPLVDYIGLIFMTVSWFVLGWWIEHASHKHPSVTTLMEARNRDWMEVFVTRDPRIFDSQILGNLRQGTAFFASTNVFAIGGVIALIGNTDPLSGVVEQVTATSAPRLLWQLKLACVGLFLTVAYLKFVWAHRVFGYCSVLMASVPNDPKDPRAFPRARQAAELNIRAVVNFNRGLRAMYFALGALAWLLGGAALIVSMAVVVWIIWSREFSSVPRSIIKEGSE